MWTKSLLGRESVVHASMTLTIHGVVIVERCICEMRGQVCAPRAALRVSSVTVGVNDGGIRRAGSVVGAGICGLDVDKQEIAVADKTITYRVVRTSASVVGLTTDKGLLAERNGGDHVWNPSRNSAAQSVHDDHSAEGIA